MAAFECRICGAQHELPEALSAGLPEPCLDIPESEREERIVLGDESCKLDEKRVFLRGNIELPIEGEPLPFVWTIWVELEKKHFKRALALWMRHKRTREAPYPARLATALPQYEPSTMGVSAEVHSQPVGVRFSVTVLGDHPLAREQQEAVPGERMRSLAEMLAHG